MVSPGTAVDIFIVVYCSLFHVNIIFLRTERARYSCFLHNRLVREVGQEPNEDLIKLEIVAIAALDEDAARVQGT